MSKEKKNNLLMISEFSKIAEVSRKALIFYDKIGVFSPRLHSSQRLPLLFS